MLKERRRAAELVANDFLQAESAIDAAAMHAMACVTTMLAQRREARLPVTVGLEALQIVSEAANDMVRVRQRIIEAHALLVEARADIGVRSYGDQSECPPDYMSATAAPHLAAVA